jgi:hypothetical protein
MCLYVRTAKWPFMERPLHLILSTLKTLSLQVATGQAEAGKSAPEEHGSRTAIRHLPTESSG